MRHVGAAQIVSGDTPPCVVPASWRYASVEPTDPVRRAKLKAGRLSIRAGGSGLAYSLDEAHQGRMAFQLQLGTVVPWCGNVVPSVDVAGKFVGVRQTAAPLSCPSIP